MASVAGGALQPIRSTCPTEQLLLTKRATLPEANSSHLNMDGWNTSFLLGCPIFRGYVSFRECIDHFNWHFSIGEQFAKKLFMPGLEPDKPCLSHIFSNQQITGKYGQVMAHVFNITVIIIP